MKEIDDLLTFKEALKDIDKAHVLKDALMKIEIAKPSTDHHIVIHSVTRDVNSAIPGSDDVVIAYSYRRSGGDDAKLSDNTEFEELDIELAMNQGGNVSRDRAILALRESNGDIINAVMSLTTFDSSKSTF